MGGRSEPVECSVLPVMLAAPASQGLEKSGQLGLQVEGSHQLDRWTFTDMLLQKRIASPVSLWHMQH